MPPTIGLEQFSHLLARHLRAVQHHLCKEIARSGHPQDVITARRLDELDGAVAYEILCRLYSPHIRRAGLRALLNIHAAQVRLERGRYLQCHDCGAPMSEDWLRQHPAALRCASCLPLWKQAMS